MPGRWVRGEGKKCDQGGPPGKQLVGCLRHFAFSKFRIFRMFFWVSYAIRKWPQFREIIRNFSCHFSMQIYTKFRVFREILWLFIPIFQRFITDDIFYTQQRNFKTLIGGGGGEVRQYTPQPPPPLHPSPEPAGGIGGEGGGMSRELRKPITLTSITFNNHISFTRFFIYTKYNIKQTTTYNWYPSSTLQNFFFKKMSKPKYTFRIRIRISISTYVK
jgi:hypothetical protein